MSHLIKTFNAIFATFSILFFKIFNKHFLNRHNLKIFEYFHRNLGLCQFLASSKFGKCSHQLASQIFSGSHSTSLKLRGEKDLWGSRDAFMAIIFRESPLSFCASQFIFSGTFVAFVSHALPLPSIHFRRFLPRVRLITQSLFARDH